MKSLIAKLSLLLVCGILALSSCTDFAADLQYIDNKVDELAAKTEQEILDLAASIAETYATKAELEEIQNQLNDLKEAAENLQDLLDSKADKSELAAAIADLEAKIDAIKECTCDPDDACTCDPDNDGECNCNPVDLTEIYTILDNLQEQIDAIKECNCDPDADNGCVCDPDNDGECDCNPDENNGCDCEPVDLSEINNAIDILGQQIDAMALTIQEIKDELAAINPILEDLNAKILAAMELAESAVTPEEVEAAFAELEGQINAELDAIKEDIAEFADDYNALNQKISNLENALAELSDKLDQLAKELRDIVMVPQILSNGTPAVEFISFAYVPMAIDNDEVPAVEGNNIVILGSSETAAYYHFNPSNFDINSATYSIISTDVETRSASEPVATVTEVVNAGDKVRVGLLRGKGTDNMFAIAVTLQSGAVITSEYAYILDAQSTSAELVIVDNVNNPLYATLAETEAGNDNLSLTSNDEYNFADYVKPIDPYFASFGIEYKYSVVYGDITVAEDGVADLSNGNGVSIIKVEAVNGNDVIRRAYIRVFVNYVEPEVPGVYYYGHSVASVEAHRIAFEVKDIFAWVKALKDEPNTIEILKEVAGICKTIAEIQASDKTQVEKLYLIKEEALKAYELLNGVPGFVKKFRTFEAEGEATVRAQILPRISTVAEIKAVIEMIEEAYPQINIADDLAAAIENFIPESLKNNFIVSGILNSLKDFTLSDILENEIVVNLLNAGTELAEKLGFSFIDYDKLNAYIEDLIRKVVGDQNFGEAAAKLMAQASARAAAEEALLAQIDVANAELLANLDNGVWGKIVDILEVDLNLDNEIVVAILDRLNLTETVEALTNVMSLISQEAEDLVQYRYENDHIVYTDDEPVRREVK
ncbi:MAG: hypothetical protein J6U71_02435 [Bacteroidales bacterium]|nr:hypothetical protein [Bacteroidales bacterium]